jgi:hypothetical protein
MLDLSAPTKQALNAAVPASGELIGKGPRLPIGVPVGVPVWIQALEISWSGGVQFDKSNLVLLPVGSN